MTLEQRLEQILLNLREKALDPGYAGGELNENSTPEEIKVWLFNELENQIEWAC